MKKLLQFSFILATYLSSGQTAFEKMFKPSGVSDIFLTYYDVIKSPDDSGYYTLSTFGGPDSGAILSLVGNDGILKWSKSYQRVTAIFKTFGLSVLPLSDSTLMLNLYDDGRTIQLKTSYSGTMLGAKKLNYISSTVYFQEEKNNAIYGVGRVSANGVNGGLFCKMDLDGNIIWSRMMNGGTSRRIELRALTLTSDGGFLLAGTRQIYGTILPASTILIKTDSIGNITWQRQLNYVNKILFLLP